MDGELRIYVEIALDFEFEIQRKSLRTKVWLPHAVKQPKQSRILVFCEPDDVKAVLDAGAAHAGLEYIDKVVAEEWFEFDVAIAHPNVMRKVLRIQKILGPRGLMPTIRAGTVGSNVTVLVKSFLDEHTTNPKAVVKHQRNQTNDAKMKAKDKRIAELESAIGSLGGEVDEHPICEVKAVIAAFSYGDYTRVLEQVGQSLQSDGRGTQLTCLDHDDGLKQQRDEGEREQRDEREEDDDEREEDDDNIGRRIDPLSKLFRCIGDNSKSFIQATHEALLGADTPSQLHHGSLRLISNTEEAIGTMVHFDLVKVSSSSSIV